MQSSLVKCGFTKLAKLNKVQDKKNDEIFTKTDLQWNLSIEYGIIFVEPVLKKNTENELQSGEFFDVKRNFAKFANVKRSSR